MWEYNTTHQFRTFGKPFFNRMEINKITLIAKRFGLASHMLRTLVTIHSLYPQKVCVDWSGLTFYSNGPDDNVWDLLYKQPDVVDGAEIIEIIEWNGELPFPSRTDASKIIEEKFILQDKLKNEIDTFYDTNMKDKKVLAVHRRAIVYNSEMPPSELRYFNKIKELHEKEKFDAVLICSDFTPCKNNLIDFVKSEGIEPIYYNCYTDSRDNIDYPNKNMHENNNTLALEVVIEMYLMSKCHSIIRNESGVSHFPLLINADLIEHYIER